MLSEIDIVSIVSYWLERLYRSRRWVVFVQNEEYVSTEHVKYGSNTRGNPVRI